MRRIALALCVLFAVLLVGVVDVAYHYPQLPQKMASHFDGAGRADGWSSKQSFLTTYAITTVGMAALFLLFAGLIPRLPVRMINLHNKDYWLAPDRKVATCRWIATWLLWMGNATLAFLAAIFHLTIRANLGPRRELGSATGWLLGVYGAFVLLWSVWVLFRFRRPRGAK
jgi:uncharacterized membrane protein